MDWSESLDGYCERLGPGLWAEALNFLTNAAFILAALVMAGRCRAMPTGLVLSAILFVIGIGSALFHSFATQWASLADVLPIAVFILAYIFVATRDFLGLNSLWSGLAALAFLPYAALTVPLWSKLPGLGSSAGYAPVPVVIFLYAFLRRGTATGRGLLIGGLILCLSILFRSLDMPLCESWPAGTHFLWHLTNGVLLAWMIEVWRRHRLEGTALGR